MKEHDMRPIQQPFVVTAEFPPERGGYHELVKQIGHILGMPLDDVASVYVDGRGATVVRYLRNPDGNRYVEPERADRVNHVATQVHEFPRTTAVTPDDPATPYFDGRDDEGRFAPEGQAQG